MQRAAHAGFASLLACHSFLLPCFFLVRFCRCAAQNSLIHLIWVEYGPFRCAQFFTEVQKMYEFNCCPSYRRESDELDV